MMMKDEKCCGNTIYSVGMVDRREEDCQGKRCRSQGNGRKDPRNKLCRMLSYVES
jgi:hypothetical protein